MVAPLVIGLGLTALGALGSHRAAGQREDAFNAVINRRDSELSGFNERRDDLGNSFAGGLRPIAAQGQGIQTDALRNLLQLGQQGNQRGMDMIQGARQDVAGLAPFSNAFGANNGAGQRTLQNFNQQQQPFDDAQLQFAAQTLSGTGRERGNIMRGQQLGLMENQSGLQQLQRNNSTSSANIGLDDLMSQLRFGRDTKNAQSAGSNLNAFSQLATTAGGMFMGGGFS